MPFNVIATVFPDGGTIVTAVGTAVPLVGTVIVFAPVVRVTVTSILGVDVFGADPRDKDPVASPEKVIVSVFVVAKAIVPYA
jgi:hypothetical protein